MIEKTSAYKTSDNQPFYDLASAQQHEIILLIAEVVSSGANDIDVSNRVAAMLVEKAPQVIDILTSGGKARPRARKINGAKRKAKTPSPEAN